MKNLLLILSLIVFVFACQNDAPTAETDPVIEKLEAEVAQKMTAENASQLISSYRDAIAENPQKHDMASNYLYKIAEIQYRQNKFSSAIGTLQEVLKNHMEGSQAGQSALLLATIYKEKMKNDIATSAVYQMFPMAFPNHEKAMAVQKDYGNEPAMDKKIMELGQKLMNDSTNRIDYRVANDFMGLCELHALMLPKDSQSPEYLYKAGETAQALSNYQKAIGYYDWIMQKYADHPKGEQALFLKAFTFDNYLKKSEEARPLYEEFLKKYPNNDFADDTKFLLENLGKSDEEILQSLDGK